MKKTYRVGRRLDRTAGLAYILLSAEVAFFFIVYLYILSASYPQLADLPLLMVFGVIEVLVVAAVRAVIARMRERVTVTVDSEGVTASFLFGSARMLWSDFQEVGCETFSGFKACPIYFIVDGKRYMPSQYLDDLAGLCTLIVSHIRDHAKMPADIDSKLESYRILKV